MAKKRRARVKRASPAHRQLIQAKAARAREHRTITARDKKMRALKARFLAAHATGSRNLAEGDYNGLQRAIEQEADAIERFRKVTEGSLPPKSSARRRPRARRSN